MTTQTKKALQIPGSIAGDPVATETWIRITGRLKSGFPKHDVVDLDQIEHYSHYNSVYENARLDVVANGFSLSCRTGSAIAIRRY